MTNYYTNTSFKLGQPVYVAGQQKLFRIFQIDKSVMFGHIYHVIDRDGLRGQATEKDLTPFRNTQKQMKYRIQAVYTSNAIKLRPNSGIRETPTAQTRTS